MKNKIVIAENNIKLRENLVEILELDGYEVLAAENGKIAIKVIEKNKPDLIICDIMLPDLDGYGVLHILNKKSDLASIPFLFLTAKVEKSDFRKGMSLGADDYLTKPFQADELLRTIETRIKFREIITKHYNRNLKGWNCKIEENTFNLIKENKHSKLFSYLENKIDRNSKIYETLILIQSTYYRIQENMLIGLISNNEYEVSFNKINISIIHLVNGLKDDLRCDYL